MLLDVVISYKLTIRNILIHYTIIKRKCFWSVLMHSNQQRKDKVLWLSRQRWQCDPLPSRDGWRLCIHNRDDRSCPPALGIPLSGPKTTELDLRGRFCIVKMVNQWEGEVIAYPKCTFYSLIWHFHKGTRIVLLVQCIIACVDTKTSDHKCKKQKQRENWST